MHCVLRNMHCVEYHSTRKILGQWNGGFAILTGVLMLRFIAASSLIGFCLLFAVAQSAPPKAGVDALPEGPGKQVVQKNCLSCHGVRIATSKRGTEDDWAATVSQMIGRGANISDDDADTIVEYMAAHFGPENSKSKESNQSKSASSAPAPDNGKGETQSVAPTSVNVNKANVEQLETSLQLSQAEAEAVVHYRDLNGDFKDWEQVAAVPGGDAQKIKDHRKSIVF
jgi:competence protein ComEA